MHEVCEMMKIPNSSSLWRTSSDTLKRYCRWEAAARGVGAHRPLCLGWHDLGALYLAIKNIYIYYFYLLKFIYMICGSKKLATKKRHW